MADVYAQLAERIRDLARGEAQEAAPTTDRMTVVGLAPLELESSNGVRLDEEDDDVELHRTVADLIGATADPLVVGDVVEVREDGDGWTIVAVLT